MFKEKRKNNSEAGFTLVEIAIVLVIIGLLIGGVLKGQELIKNAKIKKVMKQCDEMRVAHSSYQDRYKFLPGDDTQANARWGEANGNGNGQLNGGAEALNAFAHLAAAGFISGTYDGTAATLPRNPFGGQYQVLFATVQTRRIHWFQTQDIPGDICEILDTSYDDGVWNTGSMIGNANYVGNPTPNITLSIEF